MKAKYWFVVVSHYPRGHEKFIDISRRSHERYVRIVREQLFGERIPLQVFSSTNGTKINISVWPEDPDYGGHKRADSCMAQMSKMIFESYKNVKEVEVWGYSACPSVCGACCLWHFLWDDMEGTTVMTLPEDLQTRITKRGSVGSGYTTKAVLEWFVEHPNVVIGSWDWDLDGDGKMVQIR